MEQNYATVTLYIYKSSPLNSTRCVTLYPQNGDRFVTGDVTATLCVCCAVAGVQTGQVLADTQPVDRHHRAHNGRTRQPLLRARHHHLHLRRHGQGALSAELRNNIRRRYAAVISVYYLIN